MNPPKERKAQLNWVQSESPTSSNIFWMLDTFALFVEQW